MLAKTGLCMSILAEVTAVDVASCARVEDLCPNRAPLLFFYRLGSFSLFQHKYKCASKKSDPILVLGHVAFQMEGEYSDILSTFPEAWRESLTQKKLDEFKEPSDAAWYISQLFCTVHEICHCRP